MTFKNKNLSMKFKEISFSDSQAKRIYTNYLDRVKAATKDLSKENQNDTLLEINSHLYESMAQSDKNEIDNILDATERLGNPEQFLKDLVAEKKLEEAATTFNPIKILKALLLNLTNGVSYIIFFVLYLSLFSFVFLIFAKIFNPEKVGLFYKKSEFFILGISSGATSNDQTYERLGDWFIPTMIICTVILFILITLLLRLKKTIKKTIT